MIIKQINSVTFTRRTLFSLQVIHLFQMGSGSSRKRQVNRHVQVPSSAKTPLRTPSPELSADLPQRPYSSQPSPSFIKEDIRFAQSNSSFAHYQRIWETNGKVFELFFLICHSPFY